MPSVRKIIERLKQYLEDYNYALLIAGLSVFLLIIVIVYVTQRLAIRDSLPPITSGPQEYQIAKLSAEIQQIRSDTQGSLFWLKMIALFVTVGGAVGGYYQAQSHATRKRIDFEDRKNIDSVYQGIVQELADESPLLRAAAAVNLGMILQSFPAEWTVSNARKKQIIQLTKQVLAASLSIERDRKVLKTLTIALVLHKPWEDDASVAISGASSVLVANIPFAFHAADEVLPPGDYAVAITATGDGLVIKGRDSNGVEIRLKRSVQASKALERAKLVFHRYAEHYFLSEVWAASKSEGHQLPKSRQERTLERQLATKASEKQVSRSTYQVVEVVDKQGTADVRELDLSGARAADAFWARVDFSYSDFYKAKLAGASFRRSVLRGAAFREADLLGAVLVQANCYEAVFKMADLRKADLRKADLTNATLEETRFEDAKVFGCVVTGAKFEKNPDAWVDNSEAGDGSHKIRLAEWLSAPEHKQQPMTPDDI